MLPGYVAQADDMYRPRPGETYGPSTYCLWNRTGLPFPQQKICEDLDRKQGAKKENWRSIEGADGSVVKIEMNSISHFNNGTAEAVVYMVEGTTYNPENTKRLWFDCQGHFRDQTGMIGPTQYAAPLSMAGQLSNIACAGAKDTRLEEASKPTPYREPDRREYCASFTLEACARIRKTVEAKVTPPFCRPGFALVGSGLSPEQLRICYVMTAPSFLGAPVAAPASQTAPTEKGSPATLAFQDCLLSQGRDGAYTSLDGGKSAIRLMGIACRSQWDTWQKECIANGGTDAGPNGCTVQAGILAQVALKLLGK
jgi:hypothetical protein